MVLHLLCQRNQRQCQPMNQSSIWTRERKTRSLDDQGFLNGDSKGFVRLLKQTHTHSPTNTLTHRWVNNNMDPTGWQLILDWVIVLFIRSDRGSPGGIQQNEIAMKLKCKLLNRRVWERNVSTLRSSPNLALSQCQFSISVVLYLHEWLAAISAKAIRRQIVIKQNNARWQYNDLNENLSKKMFWNWEPQKIHPVYAYIHLNPHTYLHLLIRWCT